MHRTLESALRESEERYRLVVTTIREGVILQDASPAILAGNAAAEELLGLSLDQMAGRTSLDPRWRAIHKDGSPFPGETHPVPVTLRTGEPQRDVVMGVHKPDGTVTWLSVNSQPLFRDGEATPYAAVCTFADITHRKLAEDALRESEERYRGMFEAALEGVWSIDLDGNTTFANPRMAEMLACTTEELSASNLWDFVDESDHPLVSPRLAARAQGISEQHDFRLKRKDGSFVWTSMSTTPITHPDGRMGALAMVRDLTGSRQMEAELSASQARLGLALSAGQMATWEWDVSSGATGGSPQIAEILGLPPDAPVTDREGFFRYVHPDDRARLLSSMKRYVESGSTDRFLNEYRFVRPDGQIRWVHSSGRAFRDSAPGHVLIMGTITDITERRGLEAQLRESQKLESLGRLAGGVAHDFNNLLTAILASVSFAEQEASATLMDELATIRTAAERAADLTRQLLAFARRQVVALAPLSVNAVVSGVEKMLRRLLGEDIELSVELADELWTVRGDASWIEQVLVNLAVNAREALPHGGPVRIVTCNTTLDARQRSDVAPGEYVVLGVCDAGAGIDDDTLEHIFEPFFTSKESGTGLGLASVYGIVKQLGGHVSVSSEAGKGSRFDVYLPRDRGSGMPPPAAPAVPAAAPDNEKTLLVVEDDDLLRRVVVRGLGELGFTVLAASHPDEALAIAESHVGPIHVLVTDVIMPRMSGSQLADRVEALRPETRVLFVSGYTDQTIARHGVLEAGRHFLAKPYTLDSLAGRIGELTARSAATLGP